MAEKSGHLPSLDAVKLACLSDAILELNDTTLPAEGLFDRVAARCEGLIPNSTLWVACSDREERSITCYFGPWAQQAIALAPAFGHHIESHPQFMALCKGIARPVDAVSDYISQNRWRATGMFQEVVRPAGAIDQLSSSVPLNGDLSFSIVINRDRWGFTPEERVVLAMLTPHVAQAWRNRLILEQPHVPADDKNGDGVSTASYQLVVDHFGNLINGPPLAILWLREHFEDTSKFGGALLPLVVRQWIMKALGQLVKKSLPITAADLSVEHTDLKGDRWCFTLIPGRRYETHRIIVRQCETNLASVIAKLVPLGLSHRQAEVLLWVAQGKTNGEIAAILGISLFTVKAHLRTIFEILLVENRNSAASIAWKKLRYGM